MDLQDKRVWLTGASSGIGEALARILIDRGASVAVSARREERLAALVAYGQARGRAVMAVPLDVTDRQATQEAVRRIEEAWGGIDLAILNAGGHTRPANLVFDGQQFVDIMTLNYFSVIYGLDAVVPGMVARGRGHVAAVSSLAGYRSFPTAGAYGASKAAVTHALHAIRFDLEPRGIGVTVVSPGWVKSELTARNRFPMPFLMETEPAAAIIVRGIERELKEVHFPTPFSWTLKTLRILPWPVYERLIRRLTRKRQQARAASVPSSR